MSPGQPMNSQPLSRHRLTVDDFYKISAVGILKEKDRVELIEGEIIDMAPIGSQHAETIDTLAYLIHKQIKEDAKLRIQNPLRLDQYNEPQPDLALVINQNYSSHHPGPQETMLVIEVADASLSYDLEIKTALYAQHNIPEVWVIDLNNCKIHVFQRPKSGEYEYKKALQRGTISSALVPSFVLDIDHCELFK